MANTKTNTKKKTKAPAAPVKDNSLPYYERYLLTIDEAAAYFHIGSKKMVELVQNHEGAKWYLFNGNRRMIKRDLFASWLDEQTVI